MMKQRSVRLVCSLLLVLAVGFLYAAAVRLFHIGIPCVFQEVTGLKCPGCGISGMCLALLRLDFKSAFLSNRLLFVLIPVFLFVFARIQAVKNTGKTDNGGDSRFAACLRRSAEPACVRLVKLFQKKYKILSKSVLTRQNFAV